MMRLEILPTNALSAKKRDTVYKYLEKFVIEHNIDLKNFTVLLDFRVSKDNYEAEGLFGGFLDLYNKKERRIYVNLNAFKEYTCIENTANVIHCVLHELTHIKQIQEKRLEILSPDRIRWKGRVFERAPFSYDVFSRIFEKSKALAQDYHTHALPWEKEAYVLPEKFMGKPLHSYRR